MARRCIDGGTQVMVVGKPGDTIRCGNCGAPVVIESRKFRPDESGTWRAIPEHEMLIDA